MSVPVTFVLTSCDRFDLLERTLASFLAMNDYPIHRYIIIEDSPNSGIFAIRDHFPDIPLEIHLNDPPVGQMRSIDRAYAMVETEFVFHCEDDWLFTRAGIVAESIALLEAFENVTMVLPRGLIATGFMAEKQVEIEAGVRYRTIDPRRHHHWGGISLNPGLRRLSDYHRMPGFAALGSESAASAAYKHAGLRMLSLEDGGVIHIGDEVSARNRNRRRSFPASLARLRRSLGSRLKHRWWLLSADARNWRPRPRATHFPEGMAAAPLSAGAGPSRRPIQQLPAFVPASGPHSE